MGRHCARGRAPAGECRSSSLRANIQRKRGESPEAAAREARYGAAGAGHETGRSAGHRPASGRPGGDTCCCSCFAAPESPDSPPCRRLRRSVPGRIARPLLDVSRAEIEAIARKLRGCAGSKTRRNTETRFSRNFLRAAPDAHDSRAMVRRREARWRAARTTHGRGSPACSTSAAAQDLARVADGEGVTVAALRALPLARRRNALRAFIARHGIEVPRRLALMEIAGAAA